MRITPTLLLLTVAASTTTALPRGYVAGGRDPFWQADAILDSPPPSPTSPSSADLHGAFGKRQEAVAPADVPSPLEKRATTTTTISSATTTQVVAQPMRGWCPTLTGCAKKRQKAVAPPADVPSPLEKRATTTTTVSSASTTQVVAQPMRGWCPTLYGCAKKRQEQEQEPPSADVLAVLDAPAPPEESAGADTEVVPQKRDEEPQAEQAEFHHHGRPGFRRHKRAGGKQA
ncbi:hypothetical protein HK104_005808 [Borealophlyctis nickersoniae]|nr:hypothetical protein HK104_005808 [Borealophlyctis nickersoniae]